MGTFLRIPIIRAIVVWGLYWGPAHIGNLPDVPTRWEFGVQVSGGVPTTMHPNQRRVSKLFLAPS